MKTSQNHSLSILFWINPARKKQTGELPIFMRVTVDGRRVEISMQRWVAADQWDSGAQKVKTKHLARLPGKFLTMPPEKRLILPPLPPCCPSS